MSRPGFPQREDLTELAADTVTEKSSGSSSQRNWSNGYQSWSAESIGANTPGWPGVKAENDYIGYRFRRHCEAAHVSGEFNFGTWTVDGTYPISLLHGFQPISGFGGTPGVAPSEMIDGLKSKLQSKIKSEKVNIGVLAAEFSQTCSTVANAARRIAQAITNIKRGNPRGALNALGGARGPRLRPGERRSRSGRGSHGGRAPTPRGPSAPVTTSSVQRDWLEAQYGWKPLLSDVHGACEELARTLNGNPNLGFATVQDQRNHSDSFTTSQITAWTPPVKWTRTVKATMKMSVEYEVLSEVAHKLASTGISNPLAIAWELIPYSFVVDWFLPVGTFLSNLDWDSGIFVKRAWYTYKSKGTIQGSVVSGTYSGSGITETWSGGSDHSEVEYFERRVGIDVHSVPLPSFKDPLSLTHALNAIALVGQAVAD